MAQTLRRPLLGKSTTFLKTEFPLNFDIFCQKTLWESFSPPFTPVLGASFFYLHKVTSEMTVIELEKNTGSKGTRIFDLNGNSVLLEKKSIIPKGWTVELMRSI